MSSTDPAIAGAGCGPRGSPQLIPGCERSPPSRPRQLTFLALFALYFAVLWLPSFHPRFSIGLLQPLLEANAVATSGVLNWLGVPAENENALVMTSEFNMEVSRGCDGYGPWALFAAAVLAFPSALMSRVRGLLVGTLSLIVLNVVRLVSLVFVGRLVPEHFELFHVDVWQPVFVLASVALFVLWASRYGARSSAPQPPLDVVGEAK